MACCVALDDVVALLATSCQRGHHDAKPQTVSMSPSPSRQPVCPRLLAAPALQTPNMPAGSCCATNLRSVGSHFHWNPMTALHSSDRQTLADSQTPLGRHLAFGKLWHPHKVRTVATWPAVRVPLLSGSSRLLPPRLRLVATRPEETTWSSCAGPPRLFLPPPSAGRRSACGPLGPPD